MQITTCPITMSSREIAELTGKQHKDVIRDIRVMLDALVDDGADLRHVREEKDGRGYTSCFHLDRELTQTLITGYSIPLRHKVIQRINMLEAEKLETSAGGVDPRLAQIAYSLRNGLISQAEANARASAVLDLVTPVRIQRAEQIKLPRMQAKKQQLAKPSGHFINFGNRHEFYLHELGAWVDGGLPALEGALIAGGFMTRGLKPTPKGARLFANRRGHRPLVYARETLEAIGALS